MEKKEIKEYCQTCNEFVPYETKKVKKTIQVKDQTLDVEIYECYCSKCGEKIFVYDYEKKNDIIVYDAYKKKVGLLTSLEIKEIRKRRGMTQIELARFLGIGDKDITRYESGSIQNKCIDNLLRLVQDDDSYIEMERVLRGESVNLWPNVKIIDFNFKAIDLDEFLAPNKSWSPYQRIMNSFNKKEGLANSYERERREEVPIA